VVEGAVVELAEPAVFGDVCRTELVSESENAVRTRFRGIKVILGVFEWGELFDRKVFRELFDREAGKIVRHLMCFSSAGPLPFIFFILTADCSSFVDW